MLKFLMARKRMISGISYLYIACVCALTIAQQ